jgi:putative ABC transport system substrate-binding protein
MQAILVSRKRSRRAADEVIEMRTARAFFGPFVAFGLACLSLAANAQQAGKLPRLGWLGNYLPTFPAYEGFREGLHELGYVQGKNIIIEARWAEGKLDRLPELARELVRLNVDVLYVGGDQGLRAAKQATETIPIVVLACDPLDSLIISLARPGGSATGLTCISSDLAGKRLELLSKLVSGLSHVAVLYNPGDANKVPEYRLTQDAASKLKLTVQAFEVTDPSQFAAVFAGMARAQAQALTILADPFMNFHAKRIANLALGSRLPAIYGFREFPEAGGLASYGASLREEQKLAARYIDKIFKGAKPSDLPVQQPTKFELLLNMKAARTLGLEIPPSVLALADEVIE